MKKRMACAAWWIGLGSLGLVACGGQSETSQDDIEKAPPPDPAVEKEQTFFFNPGWTVTLPMSLDGEDRAIALRFDGPETLTAKLEWSYHELGQAKSLTQEFTKPGTIWQFFADETVTDSTGHRWAKTNLGESVKITNTGKASFTLRKWGVLVRSDAAGGNRTSAGTPVVCPSETFDHSRLTRALHKPCSRTCGKNTVRGTCEPDPAEIMMSLGTVASLGNDISLLNVGHCSAKCP